MPQLLAAFRSLGEMLTFCVSFYEYVAGSLQVAFSIAHYKSGKYSCGKVNVSL